MITSANRRHIVAALALAFPIAIPLSALAQESPASQTPAARRHRLDPKTPDGLKTLLNYTGEPLPLVSGHRGGASLGYPENCIATFERTISRTFALLEVDPRFTKDGHIVLHHDPRLDRTTTGKGLLTDHTLEEVKKLRLKDTAGNVTEHQVPTLGEALDWARGKAVLVLDQKDVPVAARVKTIEEHKAESYAMLIVYSYSGAKECYDLNPNIMMEVMVPSRQKIAEFDQLGVPWSNVIAFVGHVPPEDPELYTEIHKRGALCLVGTSRNLDRQVISGQTQNIRQLESAYRALLARGADVFETDIPALLGPLLYSNAAAPASKQPLFIKQ
jgi:glycerophosphoryl diester phosphodiesterase